MRHWIVSAALLACAGCRTIETPVNSPVTSVRVGKRERTWEVRCDGEPLGFVVLFQDRGRVRDSLYVVRNPWHQDLGMIDGLGRAFRYQPHREEPVWVGSGTIAAGAREILGAGTECVLVELDDPACTAVDAAVLTPALDPSGAPGLPQSR